MRPSNNIQNHARHHVGLILALAGLMTAATLVLGAAGVTSAQAVGPSWSATGSLNTTRWGHTATLLQNGKVLVAGGGGNDEFNSAELYDPTTGTWSITGSLNNTGRYFHTATLLQNGKVLVAGGGSGAQSAELYDPTTGTWSRTGNLIGFVDTATLLKNGKVLAVEQNSAELYDPATGTWSYTGNLNTNHSGHTATLLRSGKVLVAGGDSAELYDPATGIWSITGNLTYRSEHTATLLPNDKVLVVGGNGYLSSAELYDPVTGIWSITGNLNTGRFEHTATLLPNGKVLVAGGDYSNVPTSAELYDPATGTWGITANLIGGRNSHSASLLLNGKVLVAGGYYWKCGSILCGEYPRNTAELYDSGTNAINDAQFFVHQHYLDFLNREPDPDGWDYWTERITSCGSDQLCIHNRRIAVSDAFFFEPEFQQTGSYVLRLYRAAYGNNQPFPNPDPGDPSARFYPDPNFHLKFPSYAKFKQDRAQVVGGLGLAQSQLALANAFVGRPEFLTKYSAGLSGPDFVDAVLATIRNDIGADLASQRNTLIGHFNTGGRGLVMFHLANDYWNGCGGVPAPCVPPNVGPAVDNRPLIDAEYNLLFVATEYFGYLRRDGDANGLNFWLVEQVNRFPLRNIDIQHAMVCSFITSIEYQQRFGAVVTRSNADCPQ